MYGLHVKMGKSMLESNFLVQICNGHIVQEDLKTKHECVEVVYLLRMESVVTHVHVVVRIPVELGDLHYCIQYDL